MSVVSKIKKKLYFVAAGYFKFFASHVLKRWSPEIIAVTGSVGKTTMLGLIEAELGDKAHYSHNANSAFGISFDLVNLRGITGSKLRWLYLILAVPIKSFFVKHTEKYYVVEIDGERPHEAEFLATWLKPDITLWVALGLSHAVQFEKAVASGEFPDLQSAITHEFATLPKNTKKVAYIDGDDPRMVEATKSISAKVESVHMTNLKRYAVYPTRTDFVFDKETFHFANPQPRELATQLQMLALLMKRLRRPLKTDLSRMPLPPGRSSYFDGKNGLRIIDSSHNAHLISMASILEMVKSLRAPHKWLIIGDIVDQGSTEKQGHEELAHLIVDAKPEMVILVGRRTKKYTAPILLKEGLSVVTTTDTRKALKYLEKNTSGAETLIFKGSQYLEWIIEKLLKNPADAALLCRREPIDIKHRKKWGLD